ncbi:ESPR-type extended signal peptide-containing protein [Neisseria cinerea]|uniref:ESPR-type extended signal peptide-containing protein n=1 Tax=Neisseria cinerea TaxID=483 RepID=UPI0028D40275|nr:YadA-like family protein [Neisseria cinerea]
MNKVFRVIWSQATQSWVAVSELTKAHKKQSSSTAKKSASGSSANLIKSSAIALALLSGHSAYAALNQPGTGGDVAVALGDGSNASGGGATVALGAGSKATGGDSFAVGWEATASATRSISIGNRSTASGDNSVALGSGANAVTNRDIALGSNANTIKGERNIAIGDGATAGTNRTGGYLGGAYGGIAIGTLASTGYNRGNTPNNGATAIGAGARSGFSGNYKNGFVPSNEETDADDSNTVIAKAFGTTTSTLERYQYNGVDINESTALGRQARAIGDQAVAIGGQVIAGMASIALGGNDITQIADKKYFKSTRENFGVRDTTDYNQEATESSKTIRQTYNDLVGTDLDTAYKSTYAQDGSVVLGMQSHSGAPLGTAIGTNALVRKGAFGATAIGAGSQVQANAEAAVAIGMGSFADGKYAVAAGTASLAKEGDVAIGYKAKATGKEGALAIGLGTNAQGDSSIMIGGADVASASKQSTSFEKATNQIISKDVTERINGKEVTRHYSFAGTTPTQGTIAQAFKELTARDMNVSSLDFSSAANRNGHASTSLGVHSLAKGDLATAIGASARADIIGSLALGTGAHATLQNAVAIGTGSTTELLGTRQLSVSYDSDGNIVEDGSKDVAYTFKWAGGINTSEGDVVSFGSSGAERQLKNVAAGRVAEDSTDAINGSQLNSITKRIAAGFKTSGNVVTDSSGVFTSKKANTDSTKPDYETAIRSEDKVQLQVGNNLKLDRNETESEIDVQDDFDKKKTVKKKIKKADFAYSLNPVLTNLTSAEFKGSDANAPTTMLTNAGVTITPVTAGKNPVSLTENGLNNGGNPITNVGGNLDGAKAGTDAPTTKHDAPNTTDTTGPNYVNPNNAATVGDVLQTGWNLQNNGAEKDFVKPYDTVNFADGNGTTAVVETTENKTSTVKYNVNVGNGLEKNDANQITVKPADTSLEVTTDGVKVKTDGTTITTGNNGLQVNTGTINTSTTGTVTPNTGDDNKVATVANVANAINNAAWTATSAATTAGKLGKDATNQLVKAGDKVTFEADKNIKITQDGSKFTFATKDNVSFETVQVGGDQGPKFSKTDAGDIKVSGSDDAAPVKITNVKPGDISETSTDAINGSQLHGLAKNTIKLAGKNGEEAATETDTQTLDKENGIAFTVKSSDGKLLEVTAKGDTITLTPKTATITTGADGVPTADVTNGKLVTAEELVTALKGMGWKATAGQDGTGTVDGNTEELIKAGETVTFKAGNNLAVKQAGKDFIYSLKTELTGLTSAEFKNQAGDKTVINNDGVTITPATNGKQPVSLTKNGLDNGGNAITNVAGNLDGAKTGTTALTTSATKPTALTETNAATVGDVLNAGWNLQGNSTAKDFVTAYDTVNFIDGNGTSVSVENTDKITSTIKYSVNTGNGLQKDPTGNTISVKPADTSLEVTNEGVKVKAADNTLTTDTNGLKVNTGSITTAAVPTVTAGDENKIATVGNVADAIKAAAWKATSAATANGENSGKKEQEVKADDTVTFEADKNIKITQAEGKFTFATKDDVKFDSIQLGGDNGPKLTKTDGNDLKVSGSNGTDPVKITNVADGNISTDSKDAINGSQFNAVANNNIKLGGDNASETNGQNLNKAGGLKFNINGADGIETKASGDSVTVKINAETKAKIDSVDDKADKNLSNITADGETKIKNLVTWKAKASNSGDEVVEANKTADSDTDAQQVGADGVLTLDAGKNLLLKRSEKTFTYALSKTLSDLTSAEFKKGDVTTKIDGDGLTIQAPTPAGGTAPKAITVNKDGISAGDKAIKDVNSGLTNYGGTDAKKDLINLGNPSTGSKVPDNNAATVGDLRNMGWVVSSDKTTDNTEAPYSEAVKNADEVKFVGKHAAKVSGKTENGVRTITVDVEVPSVETAKITKNNDGSVTGPAGETLTKALKDAKDALAKLPKNADPETVKAAKDKVDEAQKAIDDSPNSNKVATAQNVADMINNSGFTLKTNKAEGGEKDTASTGEEVINPGKAVEMVAGKNLTVKQEPNGKVTYSLNPVLSNLTSAEFKGTAENAPTTTLNNSGITITKPADTAANTPEKTVTLNQDGLNNGGNAITNVAGNLNGAENEAVKPDNADTIKNNAATVGDVLNAGWNLQGNSTAKDFVTAYDTVNFIDGDGTTVSVETADNKKTSTIKYSVNLGDGLEKTNDNKIKAKAGDGVTVGSDGIKVNTGKGLKIDATDGNKVAVNTDGTTITVSDDGKVKAVTGSTEAVTDANKGAGEKAGQVRPVEADKGKLATVDTVAQAVNSAKWMAKATNTDAEITDTDKTNDATGEGIAAGDEVTFTAGKNLRVKRDGKNFTFATAKDVSFDSVKVGDTQNGKAPVNLTTGAATTANNNEAGKAPTTALNISSGTDAKPTQLVGVGSVLNKETINTTPTGTVPAYLVDLKGTNEAPVNKNAAATVGDLQNMGWKVSSDKTTGAEGAYLDVVKNADEVKFVGEGTAVVSGKTVGGVRTITVKVDDQVSTNNAVTPVVYTKADGTKVYPVKNEKGVIEYHTTPDGKGAGDEKVDDDKVITSVNGPKGTKTPTTLSNVEGNLNGAKTGTNAPTTNAAAPNTTDATKPNYVNTHNAATVGDVLNAGWNLQNNGTAKDFVKPFDTVNFVNGGNTTAVVTTKADGTTSDVTFNVTGLPIATTIATPDGPVQLTKVGDNYYPVKADGTPDIKTDTDGNPTNGYVKADNGNYYPAGDVTFTKDPATKVTTVTPKDGKQPVTFGNSLTNPNVVNTTDAPNKAVAAPTTLNNVKGNLPTVNDADKTAHNVDGTAIDGKNNTAAPITAKDAADLLTPMKDGAANPKFVGNNAATVSDVLNTGWNLQNNGTAKDFVKPYDTVNFINGANTTAVVTTNAEGTASNVTYNVTGLPVTYTTADGTPVSKIGDKFYKVNEKGQPITADGKPAVKTNADGKPVTEDGTVIEPIDTTANPLQSKLVNPNVTNTADAPNNQTTTPTQFGNVANGANTFAPVDGKVLANDGKWYNATDVAPNGKPKDGVTPVEKPANVGKEGLIDFTNSNPNNAATIGDLQNMGWVVSAEGNSYSDQVRNANEVKFVGEGTATVTGKTDDKGVRTITVKVDDQVSTNNAIMPTSFTTKDGKKVYPVKDDKGNVAYHTTPDGKGTPDNPDTVVKEGDVVTSVNGPKGTTTPTTLQNVKSNLPNVDDKKQKAFNPDGTEVTEPDSTTNTGNAKAPLSHTVVAAMMSPFMTNEEGNFIDENGNITTDPKKYVRNPNFAANNAATVSDVLNAGWNLQGNGSAVDFVKPFDTVNFVNGKGTKAVVETADKLTSTVKFDVDAGEITAEKTKDGKATGKVVGSTTQKLKDALEAAKKEAEANPTDEAKQKALKDAQSKVDAANNQVATAQNVADMINASGFTLKTSATADGKKESGDDEVINPGKAVEMVAGKNLTVKQEADGKVTYATKDDVSFNTVNVGEPETYKNAAGETVVKGNDGKFYKPNELNVDGKPNKGATGLERDKVTVENPQVTLKREAAKKAKNNDAANEPSSALNVSSSDGKPTQITGVGSTLNVKPVDTNPNGKATTGDARPNLVDLVGTKDAPVNKNAAATVGDLQNMGWVVSTKDGNGYKDVVKNANQVDFKGGAGISVEGKTEGNVREITISVKDGEVVKPNQFTAKVNGTDTPVTKVGDQYYNTADIDPKTGEPKANVTPVTPDEGTTPTNAGNGYVTGNKVAAAIQKSGFVVGKQKDALSAADFKDEVKDEKVNPDDELRFADGNNTKVKLATKESVDKDGNKVTTTTVKVDVTGLPVQYTDKNGTPVTKVGDKYFTVGDTATEVKPADLTTNMVNPAAAPNVIGAPTTLGNVKSNLPSVNDVGKDNKSAPITAEKAADIVNKAGNNAATVSDVLNAGWNLQNNGEARDFVKPYDTVNFINGKGTVAVVETADDATRSTVKFDVDAGEITAETKDGKATGKVVGLVPADKKPADLLKAVEDAQKAVDKLAKDAAATPEAKKAAQDALKAAQDAAAPLNKVATAQNVADMINASGFTLRTSATADGKKESGNDEIINPGKAVEMVAGKNLTVTQDKNGKVTYATANDVNFNSLSLGTSPHAPTLSADEDGSLRLGSKGNQAPVRISNVAPGIKDGDAVNVSQLKGVTKDLEDKIDGVAAGSNAAASLPQVYLPGKSMVAASVGTYGSQGALAVGYSSISDNGKWLIKGQVNVNTKAKTGGGVGVGYLW